MRMSVVPGVCTTIFLYAGIRAPAFGIAVSTSKSSFPTSNTAPQMPPCVWFHTSAPPSSFMRIPLIGISFSFAMMSCVSLYFGQTRKCNVRRCFHRPMYLLAAVWSAVPIFGHPCLAFRNTSRASSASSIVMGTPRSHNSCRNL